MKKLIFIILAMALSPYAFADTIYLTDGNIIRNAKNIRKENGYVFFVIEGWESDVRSYNAQYIERIEKAPIVKKKAITPSNQSKRRKRTIRTLRKNISNNPIAIIPRSTAIADVKRALAQRYAGHYSTQKMLLDDNIKSYDYLVSLPGNRVNNEILSNLKSRYYPHFSTIKLLYESNIKAYRDLQN
jgi:hypothetical protein